MMTQVCVDANLVVMWIAPEEGREQAIALLSECRERGISLIAPDCMFAEVGAAIRRKVYRGMMDERDGFDAISVLDRLAIDIAPVLDLMTEAWQLAAAHNLPTLYDAYYLALAELRGCDFWTADERFINSVKGIFYVKHIADFIPGTFGN